MFAKLAFTNIKKNGKLYIPFLLTSVLMVMTLYILSHLSHTHTLDYMNGVESLKDVLNIGTIVMIIFSVVFLFYTNSFLMKTRKKELGLYNILGMSKRNLVRIVFWENVILYVSSVVGGGFIGVLLSKLAELVLVKLGRGRVSYEFSISWDCLAYPAILFAGLFLFLFIFGAVSIVKTNPRELLDSEKTGEHAPKANWFIGILGLIILGIAYSIAVTIESPLGALGVFFIAVVMVIIATYMIFVAGSVLLCKVLQKNKNYYYKAKHFVSVSSMAYRMKRNGGGLASICILITMILVMISTTVCLYFGAEDVVKQRNPRQIVVNAVEYVDSMESIEKTERVMKTAEEFNAARGIEEIDKQTYISYSMAGSIVENGVDIESDPFSSTSADVFDKMAYIVIMDTDDYNELNETDIVLNDGEIGLFLIRTKQKVVEGQVYEIGRERYQVAKILKSFDQESTGVSYIVPFVGIVMNNAKENVLAFSDIVDANGDPILQASAYYNFDINDSVCNEEEVSNEVREAVSGYRSDLRSLYVDSREVQKDDFFGTFGGLLFIGVMLSFVFLVVAILIIYYKQITEGFEDSKRFEIMQKVGMTKKDIQKSINSQMLTVFYMPIIMAVVHLAFAFPIIFKILTLFALYNYYLFINVTIVTVVVMAIIYAIAYKLTSKTYYKILVG